MELYRKRGGDSGRRRGRDGIIGAVEREREKCPFDTARRAGETGRGARVRRRGRPRWTWVGAVSAGAVVAAGGQGEGNDSTTYIEDAKEASKEANEGETSPSWCASKGDEGGKSRWAAWNLALGRNLAGGEEEAAMLRRERAPDATRATQRRTNERGREKRQFWLSDQGRPQTGRRGRRRGWRGVQR